jgi:hypothetical protein
MKPILLLVAAFCLAASLAAQPSTRVVICHNNLDDPTEPPQVTIEVDESSVDAHITNHGDTLGPCGG